MFHLCHVKKVWKLITFLYNKVKAKLMTFLRWEYWGQRANHHSGIWRNKWLEYRKPQLRSAEVKRKFPEQGDDGMIIGTSLELIVVDLENGYFQGPIFEWSLHSSINFLQQKKKRGKMFFVLCMGMIKSAIFMFTWIIIIEYICISNHHILCTSSI